MKLSPPDTLICYVLKTQKLNELILFLGIKKSNLNELIQELEKGISLWKLRDKFCFGLKVFERTYKLNMTDLELIYSNKVTEKV